MPNTRDGTLTPAGMAGISCYYSSLRVRRPCHCWYEDCNALDLYRTLATTTRRKESMHPIFIIIALIPRNLLETSGSRAQEEASWLSI